MMEDQAYLAGLLRLTRRERDVLRQLAAGARNDEIARRLGIRPVTVETHLTNVYRKLDVHSGLEAVVTASRCGVLGVLQDTA